MIISLISRQNHHHHLRHHLRRRHLSTLHSKYNFTPPPSLHHPQPPPPPQNPNPNPKIPNKKPQFRPQSSLPNPATQKPLQSKLPFDFYFSYTESHPSVKPIGLRGPKYSPFGPGRLGREWTGVCAPVKPRKVRSVDGDDDVAESNPIGVGPGRLGREWAGACAPVKRNVDGGDDVAIGLGAGRLGRDLSGDDVAGDEEEVKLRERRRVMRESILGAALTEAEKKVLVEGCKRGRCKRQVNLGRDGLTHNMLNDIHNHWKHDEAVRIKCMGVPTMDMDNVCTQLEDKTFGKIIHRQGGLLVLYRGRKYKPKKRPVIPLMLWKPQEPVYPKMVKTTIEGLSIEETKEMRKRGLAVPALTKLSRNGYYGNLVPMVRDAFLVAELVRIDCTGLDKSDHKKIGVKLRDLVPCIPVTFAKEQIVVWRGPNYEPPEDRIFLAERESSEMSIDNMVWDS